MNRKTPEPVKVGRPARKTWLSLTIYLLLSLFLTTPARAHEPGQSYIFLWVYDTSIEGRFEITISHLNEALDLDLQRGLTVADVQPHLSRIQNYVLERARFASSSSDDVSYPIRFTETGIFVVDIIDDYVQLHFVLDGMTELPDTIDVEYDIMFDTDFSHRGLLVVERNWKAGVYNNESNVALVFSPMSKRQTLDLTSRSVFTGLWGLIKLGIWHIWIGIDHILFLLALVLPSVVRREEGRWVPVQAFRPALIYVIKIITFFTIAHTITLSMAALDVVRLPSRFVESVIAASIALAALHNIRPLFKGEDWIIAFAFGLFHGFGFAGVLAEIGLDDTYQVLSLFGFNLGVEIGQVVIICIIFPILYWIRRSAAYPRILTYGSVVLILISIYWFIERAFEVDIPLGRILKSLLP